MMTAIQDFECFMVVGGWLGGLDTSVCVCVHWLNIANTHTRTRSRLVEEWVIVNDAGKHNERKALSSFSLRASLH